MSRARFFRHTAACGLLLLAGLVTALPAGAQGPRQLFPEPMRPTSPPPQMPVMPRLGPIAPLPPREPQVERPYIPQAPASERRPTPALRDLPGLRGPGPATPAPIVTQDLAPLQPWALGTLPATDRLARSPWDALPLPTIEATLRSLPAPTPWTAPLMLQRRVLLAPVTSGAPEAGFFALRLERLVSLGLADAAAELADRLPPASRNQLQRPVFEVLLQGGRAAEACVGVQSLGNTGAYTAAARITCALLQGEAARAQVLAGVLRERQASYWGEVEPLATGAIDGEAGRLATVRGELQPLVRAVLRHGPAMKLEGDAARLEPLAQALLASNPSLDGAVRLRLAQAAARRGLSSPAALRAAYLAAPQDGGGAALRALAEATEPTAQAERLLAAWRRGGSGADRVLWAATLGQSLPELQPSPATAGAAAAVVPVLTFAGAPERLTGWELALRDPARPDLRSLRDRLLPYFAIAGIAPPIELLGQTGDTAPDPAVRLVLEALAQPSTAPSSGGDPVLEALRPAPTSPPAGAQMPPVAPERVRGLSESVRLDAPAATAAIALLTLGEGEPAPEALAAVLRALREAGLVREAQQLAAGYLLGKGIGIDDGTPARASVKGASPGAGPRAGR